MPHHIAKAKAGLYRTVLGALALAITQCATAACSKPMSMIAEHWPPYVFEDPAQPGLDVLLAQAIFTEAGCTLVVEATLPQLHRWELFEHGKFDLMIAGTDLPERHRIIRFSAPYRDEVVGLFVASDQRDKLRDIDSFATIIKRRLVVLAPRTGWYGPEFDRNKAALRAAGLLAEFTSLSQGIQRMRAHRAAFLVSDVLAVRFEAARQHVALDALPQFESHAPVHLMLSKASTTEGDATQLSAAIARLNARGALEAIRLGFERH